MSPLRLLVAATTAEKPELARINSEFSPSAERGTACARGEARPFCPWEFANISSMGRATSLLVRVMVGVGVGVRVRVRVLGPCSPPPPSRYAVFPSARTT
eukprot:scaffold1134_cov57-Phaeocystis_antarctica.AAC.9